MSERMSNDDVREFIVLVNARHSQGSTGTIALPEASLTTLAREISAGRTSEVQKDAVIKALADYIERHAGHEEHCGGWRQPVKDKTAPSWKRKGEWMELSACTCGPAALLRLAGRLP